MSFGLAVLIIASALLLFASAWILIPPPNGLLLPLAVAFPELSPVLLACGATTAAIMTVYARRSHLARLALVGAATASAIALVPIAQLGLAVYRFNDAMSATSREPPAEITGELRVTHGVQFSHADGVPLSLDVYRPATSEKVPVLLQIHGGSWQSGSSASQEWFARYFARRGYLVVSINYRHAPQWIWPEQLVDVRNALYWISEKAAELGGDPSRIVVVGRSAGAQLAMRLAYQEGPSSLRGVVNYYGPVDLAEGWRRPPQPDPADVRGILEALIGGTPAQKPEHYRHASPLTYVSRTAAPTLSLYGGRDHIVEPRYGRILHEALTRAGATSVLLELPWSEHAFDAVPGGIGRHVSLHYVERFLAWCVAR